MNKLWLIIQREYLTRVKKKTFILATLLTPIGIGLIAFVSGYMASSSTKAEKRILIVDNSKVLSQDAFSSKNITYTLSTSDLETAKGNYLSNGYDILVEVPKITNINDTKLTVEFYSEDKLSLVILEKIEHQLSKSIKNYKISQSGIDQTTLDNLKMDISLENAIKSGDGGSGDTSSRMSIVISSMLSYIMGFLMYIVIFVYGGMVMRSVMEEKINRIVEVMISSVKPFQLMLGKIMGVGLVGLTQLTIWIILIPIIMMVVGSIYGGDMQASGDTAEMLKQLEASSDKFSIDLLLLEIKSLNWLLIIPTFIIFFLGGYFIYASLFAAVGSAIGDDLGEGQQLMMPIIIPVILAFVMVPAVFNDPDGKIAVFGSMFPLFSPIIMPARLPFNPPIWQVLLSIVILIASVIFMAWMAGRIYRVGILMYGKKVTFKELWKWLFY
ncbi:MAG: ABC transporter permease [Saprospiraceae bacterium]